MDGFGPALDVAHHVGDDVHVFFGFEFHETSNT